MSKEIREVEEKWKRMIENMRGERIGEYDMKEWLDENFIMGCGRLEQRGKERGKVMESVGGVMYVEYKKGEVRECEKQRRKKVRGEREMLR